MAGIRRFCYKWLNEADRYSDMTENQSLEPDCEARMLGNLLEIRVKPLIASHKRADLNAAGPQTLISGN